MEATVLPEADYWVMTNQTTDGKLRPGAEYHVVWFSDSDDAWKHAKQTDGLYYDGLAGRVTDVRNGHVYDMDDLRRALLVSQILRKDGAL
jgi:hypothetical protein